MSPYLALDALAEEYADNSLVTETCSEARQYLREIDLEGPGHGKIKQVALAYFFTKGRSFVNTEVARQLEERDVILDRWWASGMAYQVQPDRYMAEQMNLPEEVTGKLDAEDEAYRWEYIRELNLKKGIRVPDVQMILTCPLEQIPLRKHYRQKQGTGTSGQMSYGREELIYHTFMEIHDWLLKNGMRSYKIENSGVSVESLQDQIKQAIPTYLAIENELRKCIDEGIASGFMLAGDIMDQKQAEEFFLEPERMNIIYQRQCAVRAKKYTTSDNFS